MIVNFYGTYRMITECKSVDFKIQPGDTLFDLLMSINKRFPKLGKQILDETGNLFPYIPIYINGRNPRLLSAKLQTQLKSTDIVSLFSPIASGHINVEEADRLLRSGRKVEIK
jgi:molybdopterin synthase sulfur carrier subunit